MSVYGDLSQPQRKLLEQLLQESAVPGGRGLETRSRAVDALLRRGFVDVERSYFPRWCCFVRLTEAGVKLLRDRDFRHARRRGT